MAFAKANLNYHREKGLDFVARFNGKYVIGEAKFLSRTEVRKLWFWGCNSHTGNKNVKAIKIAILDGVLYIPSKRKMYRFIIDPYKDYYIMSSLVLREFLYQL